MVAPCHGPSAHYLRKWQGEVDEYYDGEKQEDEDSEYRLGNGTPLLPDVNILVPEQCQLLLTASVS